MKINSYHNWLVPLEIAKKIKEIGFDEYCIFYTRVPQKDDISGYIISVCHDPYDRIIPGMRNRDHIDTNTTFGVSLPTFEQVFEWFREKGFQSHIEYTLDNSMFKISISGLFLQTKDSYFKTYEEAREALVNKLIEFYEHNSWVTY